MVGEGEGFLLLLVVLLLLLVGPWTTTTLLLLLLLLAVVARLSCLASLLLWLLWSGSSVGVLVMLGRGERLFLGRSGVFDRAGHLLAVVGRALLVLVLVLRRHVLDLLRRDDMPGCHGAVLVLVAGSGRRRADGASCCRRRSAWVVVRRRRRGADRTRLLLGE